jgi:multidrug efflux pump subunit AcrB
MQLTKAAIARPVFFLMLMIAAVLLGTIGYNSMTVEENPDVEFGSITIRTPYPGANPEEVSELVSQTLEDAVSGVANLREVFSSSQESLSLVILQFDVGSDMEAALNDVRAQVDAAVAELPDDAEEPVIEKQDSSSQPIMQLVAKSETLSDRELRTLFDEEISDRFTRVDGVSQASVTGGEVREIQVQLDRAALIQYKVGVLDVVQGILGSSTNIPAGRVVTDREEFSVRLLGDFQSVDEIRNSNITLRDPTDQMAMPEQLSLDQIATVVDGSQERRSYSRLDGNDSVTVTIQKSNEGNAVTISEEIVGHEGEGGLISELQQEYGIDMEVVFNRATQIEESIFDLTLALGLGIFLVTSIIYVFLHNIRGTIIVGIAIPVSLFFTFIAMWALGFTINNLSLLALSLAIGVLVDDAIVILENIYRHLREGEPPVDAAINGRGEIGLAAIAITLADVVVFLPIAFLPGVVGQFLTPLALGFAICVTFSLFVSFTITPMLAARWYKKGEDMETGRSGFAKWFDRGLFKVIDWYSAILKRALKRPTTVFVAGFTALVGIVVFMVAGRGADVPFQAAIQVGAIMFMVTLLLGLGSFGVKTFGTIYGARRYAIVWFGLSVILAIALFAVRGSLPETPLAAAPPPALVLGGFFLGFVIMGLIGFVVNLAKKEITNKFIGGAIVFGLILLGFAVGGWAYATQYKRDAAFSFQFFPPSDGGRVVVNMELPPGTNLETTEQAVRRVEGVLAQHPDVEFVLSELGSRGSGGFGVPDNGPNYAQVTGTLYPKRALLDQITFWSEPETQLRDRSDTKIAADILFDLHNNLPGVEYTVSATAQQGFGLPIQFSLLSDDRQLLAQTAQNVVEGLKGGAVEGVITPDASASPGKPEYRAIPKRDKLAELGLNPSQVGLALRALYEGDDQAKYRVQGREYDVRVMMDLADRNDPNLLSQVPVLFVRNEPVFLTDIAELEVGQTVDKIDRRDKQEEIRISADLLQGKAAGSVQAEIEQWMEQENLMPEGVEYAPGGQAQVQAQEGQYLFFALGLGFVLVYMLLASLFNNLLYPFIVQLAQPQALAGALLALVLTNKPLNLVGFIGIIALVGLVGKNAILLVDYTNTLRERGYERFDALVEAGRTRFRPIMMTTMALLLAMLPIALAVGRGSEFRETIGIVIIGGITLSTILTLVVIPCSYELFDEFSKRVGKVVSKYSIAGGDEDDGEDSGDGTGNGKTDGEAVEKTRLEEEKERQAEAYSSERDR